MSAKTTINRVVTAVVGVAVAAVLVVVGYFVVRIFVFDTFPVNSDSMSPTIVRGDKIVVNKLIFGSRIYRKFDFSEGAPLEAFRMKGLRKIKYNDVVIFNHKTAPAINFVINSVYVKRCVGLPGDSISIVNGVFLNSSLSPKDTLGLRDFQLQLNEMELEPSVMYANNFNPRKRWTVKNFGPLYIPHAGDVMPLNMENVRQYYRYMLYEQGDDFRITSDTTAVVGGKTVRDYCFKNNYYFMSGDNVSDSHDSRYFGLVPEEFIIGVAPAVLYSRDRRGHFNASRTLKHL